MSHTYNVRTTTSNRRGRRGQWQGNQQYMNPNLSDNNIQQSTCFPNRTGHNTENERHGNQSGMKDWKLTNTRGIGRGSNYRGRSNYKNNNSNLDRAHKRSLSTNSSSSSNDGSRPGGVSHSDQHFPVPRRNMLDTDSSRLPRHAQNPFFVDELMQRFSSMLPSSELLADEESHSAQPTISSSHGTDNVSVHTFASISNNVGHGFRNSRNKSPNNGRPLHEEGQFNVGGNTSQQSNHHNRFKKSGSQKSFRNEPNYKFPAENKPHHMTSANIDARSQSSPAANMERQNNISLAHGFKGRPTDQNTKDNAQNSNFGVSRFSQSSPFEGSIIPNMINTPNAINNFNYLDSGRSNSFNHLDNGRSNNPVYPPGVRSDSPTFELPRQINDYNQFLKAQNYNERRTSAQQNPRSFPTKNTTSSNLSKSLANHSLELTGEAVASATPFNIQRPARDHNQRVPTRSEALRKIEEEYKIQLVKHTIQEREKEAKKREEYLAKYAYVDQGRRLTEAYLDEAVGYASGYSTFVESQEVVRQRQQDKLAHDALVFKEHEREKNEQIQKKNEGKQKKWLMKNKHLNAGYKLGYKENQGAVGEGALVNATSAITKRTATNKPPLQQAPLPEDISPEFLLQGGSLEEALERQEQLFLESFIYQREEYELKMKSKEQKMEEYVKKHDSNGVGKAVRNVSDSQTQNPGPARDVAPLMPPVSIVKPLPACQPAVRPEEMREKILAQLESLMSKPVTDPVVEAQKPTESEDRKPVKPASCVLKNPQGAVLVLRPTEEDLRLALNNRLEVQNEMDKHGDSAVYKPHVEQASLYTNNRFELVKATDITKATGAIPEVNESSSTSLPASDCGLNTPANETAKQDMPAIDYQAEMRAARLKMQQKYEESLRNPQENS